MSKNLNTVIIQNYNQRLDVCHGTKTINSENADEIKNLLRLTFSRYFEYLKHWNNLADLDESFDSSIEYYETQNRSNLLSTKETALILKALSNLSRTIESLRMLTQSTERDCKDLLSQALIMDKDIRREVFGNDSIKYDKSLIDEFFTDLPELECGSDDSFDAILKCLATKLND